ncbi:unnamed protein product, partial [Notodromas monacha]
MEFPNRTNMDVRVMQRSSTVSTVSPWSSGSAKIGGWFSALSDRRRNKKSMKASKSLTLGVVMEQQPYNNMGSDGESEDVSGTSDEMVSPLPMNNVKLRQKNRSYSKVDINKRLSLPADLRLPDSFISMENLSPVLDGPLTRATRRQSLSEIGFGRMETYTKLDKLGE